MINDLALDQAWKIVRLTIDEARDRHGLELYGTVAPGAGRSYDLKIAWTDMAGIWASQAMTREFLLDIRSIELVAETVFYPIIDILVTGRDAGQTPIQIMDGLNLLAEERWFGDER
jgi:hypothetical protein